MAAVKKKSVKKPAKKSTKKPAKQPGIEKQATAYLRLADYVDFHFSELHPHKVLP